MSPKKNGANMREWLCVWLEIEPTATCKEGSSFGIRCCYFCENSKFKNMLPKWEYYAGLLAWVSGNGGKWSQTISVDR